MFILMLAPVVVEGSKRKMFYRVFLSEYYSLIIKPIILKSSPLMSSSNQFPGCDKICLNLELFQLNIKYYIGQPFTIAVRFAHDL